MRTATIEPCLASEEDRAPWVSAALFCWAQGGKAEEMQVVALATIFADFRTVPFSANLEIF